MEAFGSQWFCHKTKHSGVRYEIGICIRTGEIVWVEGPYACGDWPDINIFRRCLIHYLDSGERVESDDGYIGESPLHCKVPSMMGPRQSDEYQAMEKRVASRHETCNKRFKHWGCLKSRFRHDTLKHGPCFRSVVVLTQLDIEFGEPLFDTEYDDAA